MKYNFVYNPKKNLIFIYLLFYEFILSVYYIYKNNILSLLRYNKFEKDKNTITFFCGYGNIIGEKKWLIDIIRQDKQVGGSELCLINLSESFVKKKYKVVVYCDCDNDIIHNGVKYKPTKTCNLNKHFDIFIIWRSPFISIKKIKSNKTLFWIHDNIFIKIINTMLNCNKNYYNHYLNILLIKLSQFITIFITYTLYKNEIYMISPSQYVNNIINKVFVYFNLSKNVINHNLNCISHGIPDIKLKNVKKIKNSFVWHTRFDRGIINFLEIWEDLYQIFPDITLHLIGNLTTNCNTLIHYNPQIIKNKIKKYPNNIFYYGTLSNEKTIKYLSTFEYFCYTSNIEEIFSLCIWESLKYNLKVFTYDIGALSEIDKYGGVVVKDSKEMKQKLLKELKNKDCINEHHNKILNWDQISEKWIDLFNSEKYFYYNDYNIFYIFYIMFKLYLFYNLCNYIFYFY
tara:strand:+ start:3352 stop:4722 length:1371 start_codon:yes stop_codon:yes gene_type:complete